MRNLAKQRRVHRLSKELISLAATKGPDKAVAFLSQAYKAIDKAVKTGVLKKNTAARKKSRLARILLKKHA